MGPPLLRFGPGLGDPVAGELQHQSEISSGSLSFPDLAGALAGRQSIPRLTELYELIGRAGISQEEVQPYLGFKAGNYSRHRVMRNEVVELLVLGWKPGQLAVRSLPARRS